MTSSNNKERFSDRVENYVKYRPGYPQEVVDYLYQETGWNRQSIIADIGSGTGIFTKLLLDRGHTVYAVEPNREMRQAADSSLGEYQRYYSCDGSAESTQLPDASIDGIVSAQAFHWFDISASREEFRRILKPAGYAALIWNSRKAKEPGFEIEYEKLLKLYGSDYDKVKHMNLGHDDFARFYGQGQYKKSEFANYQIFTFPQIKGRLLSSSYAPLPGHEQYDAMMKHLEDIFNRYETGGTIRFEYVTEVYCGIV